MDHGTPTRVFRCPPTSCVQYALGAHDLVALGKGIGREELGEGFPPRWLQENHNPCEYILSNDSFCLEETSTLL